MKGKKVKQFYEKKIKNILRNKITVVLSSINGKLKIESLKHFLAQIEGRNHKKKLCHRIDWKFFRILISVFYLYTVSKLSLFSYLSLYLYLC